MSPAARTQTGDTEPVFRRGLFTRLGAAARVTQISAPAGSGKTFLLRSWIGEAGLADRAAWVSVRGGERDPQRFWISVADALRDTAAGATLVRAVTAEPDLDGWAMVERLLADLDSLPDRIWLLIDDVHELDSSEALRQLELLVMRGPAELRFVLATRRDVRLGLHRLRLEGELTEIRAADLRFTADEAQALLEAAGVALPDSALALLHQRTEGWAAGLRLAALSLAEHPDPERFAAEFSGRERTVAEYLLAEVLERQPEEVRQLLLRTSVLKQVSGPLADVLRGRSGGERILQELEQAGAFVVSVDARRSWFRYHQLFAELLQLELRSSAPGELLALHGAAAQWYAEHGHVVEAVRHAQAAQDWGLAVRSLSDHMLELVLDGQSATARELLAGFPAGAITADAELAALMAGDEVTRGSLEAAERHLALATGGSASVPADRRGRFEVALAILRLSVASQRGDLPVVVEQAQRLLAPAKAADAAPLVNGADEDLRTLTLVSLGAAELWVLRAEEAERHLELGVALARRIGRPFLEASALAHSAWAASFRSFALAVERSTEATELAQRHGWTERRPLPSPTWPSGPPGSGRCDSRRQSRCWTTPSGRFEPRSSRRRASRSARLAGCSRSRMAVTPTRWPLSGPPSDWPGGSSQSTRPRCSCKRTCCRSSCGLARPNASSRPLPSWARSSVNAARCASRWRRCGSPRTTRGRRSTRSRPSWTAPLPSRTAAGRFRLSCWR